MDLYTKLETINERINSLTLTYLQKNKDYGNSVDVTYNVFGDLSTLTRIADKINRIKTLRNQEAEVPEKLEDTIMDLCNYIAIHYSFGSEPRLLGFVNVLDKLLRDTKSTLKELQESLTKEILDDNTLEYLVKEISC